MCNLDYVYEQLTAGRDAYIIDYASDLAVHYSPKFGDEVEGKGARSAGGVTVMCPQSDELLFECTLAGEIVSKEEYDCF
ncbi:MAG: hypothetical protein JNG44_06410 [Porphyromonas sp.]|uniref:hypothetical protein n=1 Tax=Porphyromonas sp. TaxID=1924944 RepID=UPI001A62F858|nr:hypothetical protein [Porphyromonas sp.]MBL6453300.1 hypothetical protein [Porphyromonas sp.]